jgi:hypothetical protein
MCRPCIGEIQESDAAWYFDPPPQLRPVRLMFILPGLRLPPRLPFGSYRARSDGRFHPPPWARAQLPADVLNDPWFCPPVMAGPVTVAAVSRHSGVSRTVLYDNPQARAALTDAAIRHGTWRAQDLAARDAGREASWRERALNAEGALKAAHAEIIAQRTRIGELLGQVRDLESEWTQEAIQRITTENVTLKQRVRQLTTDNRTLDERLKAARSNMRFQDRRLADLEAQLGAR